MGRVLPGGRLQAQAVAPIKPDCVAIGTPDPSVGYTYDHVESTGGRSQYTDRWESVTPTGSRLRIEKPGETLIQTSTYRVVDDVAVMGRMTQASGNRVIGSTDFRPGLVADPFGRACAGRSWPIPSVTASFSGAQNATAETPAGTLTIVGIREKITVPAGTFDSVHYVRTSQSRDEYLEVDSARRRRQTPCDSPRRDGDRGAQGDPAGNPLRNRTVQMRLIGPVREVDVTSLYSRTAVALILEHRAVRAAGWRC